MPMVDSQFSGSLWPIASSPPYLPAFLVRPGDEALGLPLQDSESGSAVETPTAPRSTAAIDTAALGADARVCYEPAATATSTSGPLDDPRPVPVPVPSDLPPRVLLPLRVRRVAQAAGQAKTHAAVPLAPAEELRNLAAIWNSLAGTVPFRSFEWMETWWRHYRLPGWQTYLLKVEDAAGRIVGIAPWYVSRFPVAGRVVQFLGSGEVCSEYQTILAQPGQERIVTSALSQWLATEGSGDWDLLLLTPTVAMDRASEALAEEFTERGHVVYQRPGMPCWRCQLPPTWDEFARQLSKSRRERLRQLTRKYFDTGRIRTRWVTAPADLDSAFAMFIDMHQRRRQSLGQAGCYSSERFARFHAEVSRRLCAEGKLRLLWTELDGRPVGAEYDFMDGQTIYYYSTGVEPGAIADHPGWLAMIGSLRRGIEEGCRCFDFLRGDEAYKCSWGAKPLATLETRIIARRSIARLRHQAWLGRQRFRQWAKGVKQRTARRTTTTNGSKDGSK